MRGNGLFLYFCHLVTIHTVELVCGVTWWKTEIENGTPSKAFLSPRHFMKVVRDVLYSLTIPIFAGYSVKL